MKFAFFYHAFASCWNNGHAHFVRGVTRELARMGHDVTVLEEAAGWSRKNALADGGAETLAEAANLVPQVRVKPSTMADLDESLAGADVVVVHEWNEPALITAIGRCRLLGGRFRLLFHDTHHRAVTAPHQLEAFDLGGYDGVLAFGEVLRDIYLRRGWSRRAFVWHEAADTALFFPRENVEKSCDLVWIGNWGDDERTAELQRFLIDPASQLRLTTDIHGVRYPADALDALEAAGIRYRGWLPNHRVPDVLAAARATMHVPRGPYARALPGIPTIRMFEALACGIPLVSAPWSDTERLFPNGAYLNALNSEEMRRALSMILNDYSLRNDLATTGLRVIRERHTCRHRAIELLAIADSLRGGRAATDHAASRRMAS